MDPMFSCNDNSYQILLLLPVPASIITLPRLLTIKTLLFYHQKSSFVQHTKYCAFFYLIWVNNIKDFLSHYQRVNWTIRHNNSFMLPSCFHCLFPVLFSTPPPPTHSSWVTQQRIHHQHHHYHHYHHHSNRPGHDEHFERTASYIFPPQVYSTWNTIVKCNIFLFSLRQHNSKFSSLLFYILLDSIWLDWHLS